MEPATEDHEDQYEVFKRPFQNFPVLKLHVDPRFVVYNAGPKLTPSMPYFEGDQLESSLIALQIWALLSASKPKWPRTSWLRPTPAGASDAGSKVTRSSHREDEADGDQTSQKDPAGPKTPPQSGPAPPSSPTPQSRKTRQSGKTRRGIPELDHKPSEVNESQLSDDEQSVWSDVPDWVRRYSNNIERKVFPRSSGWEDSVVDCALDKSLDHIVQVE
jgi:hypothetical protein